MDKGKIKIVILAGGQGKRMNGNLPKVLYPLAGKPMIRHLLERIEKLPFGSPSIIIGHNKEEVIKELGEKYHYIVQEEQLGTGHAVNIAKDAIGEADSIIVLYGDQPFTSAETIHKLVEKRKETGRKIVMATVKLPDFKEWRTNFLGFSRVIRDANGEILRTVESKDATEEEKKITEVNPCYFCFDADFLWAELKNLKNENTQKEFYLTDLLKIAQEKGIAIESIEIEPREALGANTKEELEILEKFIV